MMTDSATMEFSRPFRIEALADQPEQDVELEATMAECAALARRFGLPAVKALSAAVHVRRKANGEIAVRGALQGEVEQSCVVTLEPVAQEVTTSFAQDYTERPEPPAGDLDLGPEDAEPPEQVVDGVIDLGELVAQNLSLALDPYPRAPDAALEEAAEGEPEAAESPFAGLARLLGREQ